MSFYKSKDHISKEEIRAYYKHFKANFENCILKAKQLLNIEEFTFSVQEIDKFGEIYQGIIDKPEMVQSTYDELIDVFIVYYGEAWMHYFGGHWVYPLSTKFSDYGYPGIADSEPEGNSPISPVDYVYSIEKGNKQPLSEVIIRKTTRYKERGLTDFKPKTKYHE